MFEMFRTVLWLSILGGGVTLLLLALKPLTIRHFSAKWQYCIWFIATLSMILPFWKVLPRDKIQSVTPSVKQTQAMPAQPQASIEVSDDIYQELPEITKSIPAEYREITINYGRSVRIYDLIAYIWFAGMCLFLIVAFGNYCWFLWKKRRNSITLSGNSAFEEAKRELGVKHRIKVRISNCTDSPMLVGTFFPVIYVPKNGMEYNAEKMVFLHELTHLRHGDLIYKWLTLFVNAIHWFNPLSYLLIANVAQACEVFCDISVVRNMDEENKLLYMETILELAKIGGKKNV